MVRDYIQTPLRNKRRSEPLRLRNDNQENSYYELKSPLIKIKQKNTL